jgi:hypothetical protein
LCSNHVCGLARRALAFGVEIEAEHRQPDQEQPTDRKSTTCPRNGPGDRKNRSIRLPTAPPRIIPRPSAHHNETRRRPIQMMPSTTPVAINVSTQVYPVAIEKAAPELRTSVQVMVSPMISTG